MAITVSGWYEGETIRVTASEFQLAAERLHRQWERMRREPVDVDEMRQSRFEIVPLVRAPLRTQHRVLAFGDLP